jgi:hypothetical protein
VPFRFEQREATRGTSIRKRKVEEMINEKKREEDELRNYQIKARPIPAEVLISKFDDINKPKRSSKNLTESKPFSFYGKELKQQATDKQNWEVEQEKPFKASVVPWAVRVPLFKKMVEKDSQDRELRIKSRAAELKSTSNLPPRMKLHEEQKDSSSNTDKNQQSLSKEHTFKPAPRKLVPNFKEQHDKFQESLKSKRQE